MGQKVNPIGYRLAINRDWRSRWYATHAELPAFLHNDIAIRKYVKDKLRLAAVDEFQERVYGDPNTTPGVPPSGESSKVAVTRASVLMPVPLSPLARQNGVS